MGLQPRVREWCDPADLSVAIRLSCPSALPSRADTTTIIFTCLWIAQPLLVVLVWSGLSSGDALFCWRRWCSHCPSCPALSNEQQPDCRRSPTTGRNGNYRRYLLGSGTFHFSSPGSVKSGAGQWVTPRGCSQF